MTMMDGDDNDNHDDVVKGNCLEVFREMLVPMDLKPWCLYLTKLLDDDDKTGHNDYDQYNDDHEGEDNEGKTK